MFESQTRMEENGYPHYRRRNNGRGFDKPIQANGSRFNYRIDNRWIVPYNPYLTWKYKAHINVEICGSVQAVKYIHKYIYKGTDRATLQMENNEDEIKQYLSGRYIGPTEAMWHLMEYRMHEEYPPVKHLTIHLPGHQPVYFAGNSTVEEVEQRMVLAQSTLMAYFKYNELNIDGRGYLYQEFPTHYI
jgi:hypothetical protein